MERMKYAQKMRRAPVVSDGVARIELTKGLFAIIDESDLPLLGPWHWQSFKSGKGKAYYAARKAPINGRRSNLYMHQLFLPKKAGFVVDHINRNTLDNRRCNLRYVTVSENAINSSFVKHGVKGVHIDSAAGKWVARLEVGRFDTPGEAARAIQQAIEIIGNKMNLPAARGPLLSDVKQKAAAPG